MKYRSCVKREGGKGAEVWGKENQEWKPEIGADRGRGGPSHIFPEQVMEFITWKN